MSNSPSLQLEEEKLGLKMVKERILTEAQLNTALDFQKAVGGRLDEVVVRLGFVDPADLKNVPETHGPHGGDKKDEAREHPAEVPATSNDQKVQEKAHAGDPEKTSPLPELPAKTKSDETSSGSSRDGQAERNVSGGPAESERKNSVVANETGIILEALLRILVRKGIIESHEIKEEIRYM